MYFRFYFTSICKNCTPPLKKVTSLFPSNPPLKIEILSIPPLFENLVGGSTPLAEMGGSAHYAIPHFTHKSLAPDQFLHGVKIC